MSQYMSYLFLSLLLSALVWALLVYMHSSLLKGKLMSIANDLNVESDINIDEAIEIAFSVYEKQPTKEHRLLYLFLLSERCNRERVANYLRKQAE